MSNMSESIKYANIAVPTGVAESGLTNCYWSLASPLYKRGLSQHHSTDPLFGSRKEIRYCIDNRSAAKLFNELLDATRAEEKIWSDPWVQNIYSDTEELGLHIGIGLRARQNKEGFSPPAFEDDISHIELTYSTFDEKHKVRTEAALNDIVCEINGPQVKERGERGGLTPYLASSYLRRAMEGDGVRINIDSNIRGFRVCEMPSHSEFAMPDVSIFEVKYPIGMSVGDKVTKLIEGYGAIPAPGKHYKLYSENLRANLEAEKHLGTNIFPGYEYEAKLDVKNDFPFKAFAAILYSNGIKWLKPLDVLPKPFIRETINEYRVLDGKVSRFTYNGTLTPRVVVKDKGEFLYGGVLKRKEEERMLGVDDTAYIRSLPLIGTSKRTKEFIETVSSSGNHYSISVDRSINAKSAIFQVEVEYRNSLRENASEANIAEEIKRIAGIFEGMGLAKQSMLRKEDWISWK